MRRDRVADFNSVFMLLGAVKSARYKAFVKVFGVLEEFAKQKFGKDISELKFFGDLVVKGGEMNPKLRKFVEEFYENDSTRDSQLNRLEKLIEAELELASAGKVTSGLVSVGLIKVDKLPEHLKEIWRALPRVNANKVSSAEEREKLSLTPIGSELLRVLVIVTDQYKAQDVETLLDELNDVVRLFIRSNLHHRLRRRVIGCFGKIRNMFGFKRKFTGFTEADLPPKIRENIRVFRERARHGFAPYPELHAQIKKYKGHGEGKLVGKTIGKYIVDFIHVLSKLNLKEDACIQDLLVLTSRPIESDGKFVGTYYFNSLLEPYAVAERARTKLEWKEKNYDSVMYIRFLDALFSIARYNGEFDLPLEFQKKVTLRRDNDTRKDRKRKKKQKFHRVWVDAEILRLQSEFDRAIAKKTFVKNRRHLRVCLFMPQLVVMRYLGYRQQCLRRCVIGKNIVFREDGSISFYYARNEIKNEVVIDQTFSVDSCSEIPELLLMLDVLTKYYRVFLPTVRALSPKAYEEQMGRMFFAIPSSAGDGLIKRAPVEMNSQTSKDVEGNDGSSSFSYWFTGAAYELMNFDDLVDFPHSFNPHLLRGHCCDWLRKDKSWSWEAISKAMGDREETLKKEYFEEDEREQSSSPYVEYNQKLRAEREQKEIIANSVPLKVIHELNEALGHFSAQLTEERELRRKAEKDAATYKLHYEFVLSVANITDTEVKSRLQEELVPA